MMALVRTPAQSGFNRALDGWDHARGRPNRRATAMIVVSVLALHGVGGLYLYNQHFQLRVLPPPDEPPPVVMTPITLQPPPPPAKHLTLPPKQMVIHPPMLTTVTPPYIIPLAPLKTVDMSDLKGPPDIPHQEVATLDFGPKAGAGPKTIGAPNWISRPTGEQMARYYPPSALTQERGGSATLSCTVDAAGAIKLCTVVRETPAGEGFGAAALKLSRYFRMSPRTEDGQPVDGGQVLVPVKFAVSG